MTYPTPWQRKILWTALTGLGLAAIIGLVVGSIYLTGKTLSFLQPLLLPVAVAGVLSYLLDPVVVWMTKHRIPRFRAVIMVFAAVTVAGISMLIWLVPTIYFQSLRLGSEVPVYAAKARLMLDQGVRKYAIKLPDFEHFKKSKSAAPAETPPIPSASPGRPAENLEVEAAQDPYRVLFGPQAQAWIREQLPDISARVWTILKGSIGGFFGAFGFVIGLFIIPVYLFFLLVEADNIAKNWTNFLPLRASHFKDEVVVVVGQVNNYIIAFFRGQLVVSVIDGILVGTCLLIMGLPFALLIGLMVCFLCIIPYLGVILCWVPAVTIAAVEFKDWLHPMYVTVIFFAVQQIEGIFISPKIVGNSVGLHPMTIIISVFAWSLLLGGLLGAVLAIPLTAVLKVLLSRYVWQNSKTNSPVIATEAAG